MKTNDMKETETMTTTNNSETPAPKALADACCSPLLDKNGREIMVGDTIKVFHFIGARRKKHYMYKYVAKKLLPPESCKPMFRISHLSKNIESHYHVHLAEGRLDTWEIVQGFGLDGVPFEDRPIL